MAAKGDAATLEIVLDQQPQFFMPPGKSEGRWWLDDAMFFEQPKVTVRFDRLLDPHMTDGAFLFSRPINTRLGQCIGEGIESFCSYPYPREAAREWDRCARRWPGEVYVLTCGAMTNVAAALCAEPGLAGVLAGVVSGAGEVLPLQHEGLDWNVAYDVTAAEVLGRSGVPWTVIGWNAFGGDHSLKPEELATLAASGLPSAEALLELIVSMKRNKPGQQPNVRSWRDVKSVSTCDVTVLASLVYGDRIGYYRGRVEVQPRAGCLGFVPEKDGPHRWVAAPTVVEGLRKEILSRLLSAPARPGA